MHAEILERGTEECLALLGPQAWLKDFYLAGGTAVALQLGHRLSLDLDFFSAEKFDPKQILPLVAELGPVRVEMEREGTLWLTVRGVKVSFIHYPYSLIDTVQTYAGVAVAGLRDLACMKLDALSSRGSRRDFVDLYFILKTGGRLEEVFSWFESKYRGVSFNRGHLLKSLVYFEDADRDAEPRMILPADWREIQAFFQREVKRIVF